MIRSTEPVFGSDETNSNVFRTEIKLKFGFENRRKSCRRPEPVWQNRRFCPNISPMGLTGMIQAEPGESNLKQR